MFRRGGQPSRKTTSALARRYGSSAPQSSRALCIERIATPMSTVRMPCRAAVIGPIVVPQGMELLETKDWKGTFALSQAAAKTARPEPSVA